MAVISKVVFDSLFKDVPCYTFFHPWNKMCLKATPFIFKSSLIGSARFFALIYLGQLLMQGKKLEKKEQWIKIAKDYWRSVVTTALISTTGLQLVCLFRSLLGRFHYHFFLSVPFTLCGIFLTFESPSRRLLITNFYCNLLIEYFLKYLNRAGLLSLSKTKEVLIFMIGNSLLLYLIRLEKEKEERSSFLWLINPEKVRKTTYGSENVCPHEGDCKNYILKEISTYFGIGLAVSLAKVLIPRFKTPVSAISSIRSRHFKLALFLGSYVGIYKAIICYLCHKNGCDSATYALPAGCLAGLSMFFNPNLSLSVAPFTAAVKYARHHYADLKVKLGKWSANDVVVDDYLVKITENRMINNVKERLYSSTLYEKNILPSNIPLPMMLFCLSQGILYSARIMDAEICPRYMFYLMDTVTNGLSNSLYNNFLERYKDFL